MGCSPPGSSVHGLLQASILEWVAMPSSRGSFWPRDGTQVSCVSCIDRRVPYHERHLAVCARPGKIPHDTAKIPCVATGSRRSQKKSIFLKKCELGPFSPLTFWRLILPQTRITEVPFPGHSSSGSPQHLTASSLSLQLHTAAGLSSFAASLQVRIPWGACGCPHVQVPPLTITSESLREDGHLTGTQPSTSAVGGHVSESLSSGYLCSAEFPRVGFPKDTHQRKSMTNIDSKLKSRDVTLTLLTKVHLLKAILFSQWSCMDVRVGP